MFRLIDRRPFISGLIIGFIGTRMIGRKLQKLLPNGITIIQIEQIDETPSGKEEIKEEN